ncbi:MAG TPA: threonine--tRNA ligase [Candidatus Pacearchaeota archaeon]|nr:threonine--tRNA ligase [Candidatus Pacearchaeota archaeon]
MKTLNLHVDYIKFKPLKKALKSIGELAEKDKKEKEVKEALVVLIAVEKCDSDVSGVVKQLVENVKDIASQVKAKNIVLYPYAHLSKDLGNPDIAQEVLEKAEKALDKEGFKVARAPFGYYKEFELKVKGHPLSELSREIRIDGEKGKEEGKVIKGKEAEEKYDPKQLLREISKSKLDSSKLKDNDHRILGKQMDLFSFSEVAPGMVFWHNNGLIIRNELINFWREEHRKAGYQEIQTPQILDKKLWQISGHWEKYKDNIFLTDYEKRTFAIKPMNCPGGMLVFKNSPKSYKDLPLRVGELGVVHRQELSGVLGGLFRVIQFTQDDAHIYCTEDQLESEIVSIINLVKYFYDKLGLDLDHVELSTRPEKRIGSDEIWDKAEKALENVLKKLKMKYKINKGDGAFYGPKIDYHVKDSLERTWQTGTIQLDMAMPERFDLEYTDKSNTKKRPIMLHRTLFGSLERFIGILLENTNGRLPTWLAPVQVRVLSFTDRNVKYAEQIVEKMKKNISSLRIETDFDQKTIQAKVKEAEEMKIPYIIVIGDKEEKEGIVAVRKGGENIVEKLDTDEFIFDLKMKIEKRI